MFGQDDQQEDTNQSTIEPTTDNAVADSGSTDDTATDEANDANGPTPPAAAETTETDDDNEPEAETASAPATSPTASSSSSDDDLLELKKEALTDLAPLIDHLDQTPEEHFKTTMMLIQATDDSSHIKAAYESAKKIPDDTARAQALLDIVNEINYFTQQHNSDE